MPNNAGYEWRRASRGRLPAAPSEDSRAREARLDLYQGHLTYEVSMDGDWDEGFSEIMNACEAMEVECIVTLTYAGIMTDESRLDKDLWELVELVRRVPGCSEFDCVSVLEKRAWDQGLNLHLAIREGDALSAIERCWPLVTGAGNGSTVLTPFDFARPAGVVAVELARGLECRRLYRTSLKRRSDV